MAYRVKDYIRALALLMLLMIGSTRGLDGPNTVLVLRKRGDGGTIFSRKLLAGDVVTHDYYDVCPNPKHGKKPGCKNSP